MNDRFRIGITGFGSLSPLGRSSEEVNTHYCKGTVLISSREYHGIQLPVAPLSEQVRENVEALRHEEAAYKHLDQTVLYGMLAARDAVEMAGWRQRAALKHAIVNIGSSRGATDLFEKFHKEYLATPHGRIPPLVSPTTTLGNISSWIANDLGTEEEAFSHSITCSTSLQAVGNGIAWLRSGMARCALVGGAESPLTSFTISQMRALRIYSNDPHASFPCRPWSKETPPHNTMVLGEGAGVFALEIIDEKGGSPAPLAIVEGFGSSVERIPTGTGISGTGIALQRAMRKALDQLAPGKEVDAVVLHSPGTVRGDRSELHAINEVFADRKPVFLSNKWMIGHTLGASGALSMGYALHLLSHHQWVDFPYPALMTNQRGRITRVMVNSAGFGGNAASVILSNP